MRKEETLKFFRDSLYYKQRVKEGIEKRKSDFSIIVKDKCGNKIEDYVISYKLVNHEFKYGCNVFMLDEFENEEKNALFREKFPQVNNIATLPFYWNSIEPVKGEYRFEKNCSKMYRRPAIDLILEYLKDKKIVPKAHCLSYCYPEWLKGYSVEETKTELERHIKTIAERYKDVIPSFEVTNETNIHVHDWATDFFDEDNYVEWCFEKAKQYLPQNKLIINEEWAGVKKPLNNRNPYYMQIQRLLLDKNVRLDSIGFQFHGFYEKSDECWHATTMYNPEYMYKLLDLFAKLNKPIQVTEMTIPAFSNDEEDEWVQAELIYNLYKMFFSHESVEAVIYWNMVDGYAAFAPIGDMSGGENKFFGGLMRFDMTEKPAFAAIKKLFKEELVSKGVCVPTNGEAKFNGFFGEYELMIDVKGKTIKKNIQTLKSGKRSFEINV